MRGRTPPLRFIVHMKQKWCVGIEYGSFHVQNNGCLKRWHTYLFIVLHPFKCTCTWDGLGLYPQKCLSSSFFFTARLTKTLPPTDIYIYINSFLEPQACVSTSPLPDEPPPISSHITASLWYQPKRSVCVCRRSWVGVRVCVCAWLRVSLAASVCMHVTHNGPDFHPLLFYKLTCISFNLGCLH